MDTKHATGGSIRTVLEFVDVWTRYRGEMNPALRGVTLRVEEGEFILITGPNGAGKTTLIETSIGLLRHERGIVRLLGLPPTCREARLRIGYLPQDFMKEPYEPYTARQVVEMALSSFRKPLSNLTPQQLEAVDRALSLVGVKELAHKSFGRLSAGQQQKVLMARVLARNPKVLFLDEPFSSLDHESRLKMSTILSKLNMKGGVTIIMVSHDLSIIPEACGRIVEMQEGRIIGVKKCRGP